jgi:hypothetical protein
MSSFNEFRLDPDDPRLTAYALDELEGEERAQVAAAVAADPSLRAAVDEIRAAAGRLTAALKVEPLPEAIRPVHLEPYHTVRPARVFPFPYWAVAGLAAAACFVVLVALRELPLSEKAPLPGAGKLADDAGAEQKSLQGRIAGQQQASNHVEIRFPTTEGGALATSGGPTDQWGVVLPNSPRIAVDATAGPAAGASGGSAAVEKNAGASAAAPHGGRQPGHSEVAGAVMDNAFLQSAQNPLSSFPVNVDASGYANVRRFLADGRQPPRAGVRLEELVNYFNYDYAAPKPEAREPITASLEVASAPWEPLHRLVRIGLKARELPAGGRVAIIARNVAVQVEFNPAQVQAYRLLGYENPGPEKEDPDSGRIDARDIESGRAITAFYEVVPAPGDRIAETGNRKDEQPADSPVSGFKDPASKQFLTVKIRYRTPDGDENGLIECPLIDKGTGFADASSDFRFAAAVVEFGLVLRDSPYKANASLADALHWAGQATGRDPGGARGEFILLVRRAETILAAQG